MGFWPVVLNVLKNSDVVLLVVDARMPTLGGKDEVVGGGEIVSKVGRMGKKLIYVFNKIDLVSERYIKDLREGYSDGFFISCKGKSGVQKLKKFLEELASRKSSLRGKAHFSNGKPRFAETGLESYSRGGSLRVGVVGYPNVGKSSLINLLVSGTRVRVGSVSGTTKKVQWIRSGGLKIMDSPGVIPFGDSFMKVGIMGGKDIRKMKNPEDVAFFILRGDKRAEVIKKFYGVGGESVEEVFEAIGKKKGYLVKGGRVDENRTAIKIVEDWQKGEIKLK